MTTIACDGSSIAADCLVTGNGMVHSMTTAKVFDLRDGRVVGMAGGVYYQDDALAFLNGDRDSIDFGDEFEAIILHPNGMAECMDGKGRRYEQPSPCATGSGSGVALGAMAMGADAVKAVRVAMSIDIHTGGGVMVKQPRLT